MTCKRTLGGEIDTDKAVDPLSALEIGIGGLDRSHDRRIDSVNSACRAACQPGRQAYPGGGFVTHPACDLVDIALAVTLIVPAEADGAVILQAPAEACPNNRGM